MDLLKLRNLIFPLVCSFFVTFPQLACDKEKSEPKAAEIPIQQSIAAQGLALKRMQDVQNSLREIDKLMEEARQLLPSEELEKLQVEQSAWDRQGKAEVINNYLKKGLASAEAYNQALIDRGNEIRQRLSIQFLIENPNGLQGYYLSAEGASIEIYQFDKESSQLQVVFRDTESGLTLTASGEMDREQKSISLEVESDELATFKAEKAGENLQIFWGNEWSRSKAASLLPTPPSSFTRVKQKNE